MSPVLIIVKKKNRWAEFHYYQQVHKNIRMIFFGINVLLLPINMPLRVAVEFIYVPIKVSLADTLLCQYTPFMSQPGTPPYKSLT